MNTVNMQNPLSESAFLASVKISQWEGRKLDRKVTGKATQDHGAKDDAGRFNKQLLDKEAFKHITRAVSKARDFHESHTLPWQDNGTRILSAVGFVEYQAGLAAIRQEFESAVAAFIVAYPKHVEDAPARLGKMFNAADFPDADEIKNLFGFKVKLSHIPDAADFRVQIPAGQAAAIRAEIEASAKEALAGAMREAFERVAGAVGHMAERLKAYRPASGKGDKSEGVFRDSLVTNVAELAALLPSLNLTGDPKLAEIAENMKALCKLNAEQLRADDSTRAKTAAAAAALVAEVESHMGTYYA